LVTPTKDISDFFSNLAKLEDSDQSDPESEENAKIKAEQPSVAAASKEEAAKDDVDSDFEICLPPPMVSGELFREETKI